MNALRTFIGEHGREILGELGLSSEEIEALAKAGGVVLPE